MSSRPSPFTSTQVDVIAVPPDGYLSPIYVDGNGRPFPVNNAGKYPLQLSLQDALGTGRDPVERGSDHSSGAEEERAGDPDGDDVVHFSVLTVPRDTLGQMENVRALTGAIVMMPIFTDHADETAWALHLQVPMFAGPDDTAQLDAYLDHFAQRGGKLACLLRTDKA